MVNDSRDKREDADADNIVSFNDAARPHAFARKEQRLEQARQAFESYLEAGQNLSRQQKRKKERDRSKKGRPNKHP